MAQLKPKDLCVDVTIQQSNTSNPPGGTRRISIRTQEHWGSKYSGMEILRTDIYLKKKPYGVSRSRMYEEESMTILPAAVVKSLTALENS